MTIIYGIKRKCEGLFHATETLEELQLAQLDKVLYNWFTATCKSITGLMMIEKGTYFYDEINTTDKRIFSVGSRKKLPVRT
jgi:hypothetical protein